MEAVREAKEKFGQLIKEEFGRIERMKQYTNMTDFAQLDTIVRYVKHI